MSDLYPPSVTVARLYEAVSKRGKPYYRGKWGFANIVLLPTEEKSDSGQPIWVLKISEAPGKKEAREAHAIREMNRDQGDGKTWARTSHEELGPLAHSGGDWTANGDEMPF